MQNSRNALCKENSRKRNYDSPRCTTAVLWVCTGQSSILLETDECWTLNDFKGIEENASFWRNSIGRLSSVKPWKDLASWKKCQALGLVVEDGLLSTAVNSRQVRLFVCLQLLGSNCLGCPSGKLPRRQGFHSQIQQMFVHAVTFLTFSDACGCGQVFSRCACKMRYHCICARLKQERESLSCSLRILFQVGVFGKEFVSQIVQKLWEARVLVTVSPFLNKASRSYCILFLNFELGTLYCSWNYTI